MRLFAIAGAVGAALVYFLDPDNGRRRRALARDRTAALFRRFWRRGGRAGRAVTAEAYGVTQKVAHLKEEEKPQPDDVTLARKVETELFRDPDVPKGQININAENGVIVLRGEVEKPDMIDDLVAKARNVQGVRDVENLLHLPETPAPTTSERS